MAELYDSDTILEPESQVS
ncbi:uncharacterized protein ARMOST_03241 [Armillaria ostoyae]|uniref:Uncharacterized protein n=1 Tax=Armillaria ostoyae TaxID=47428 RepID=A0A284QTX9_ARMOS|nr:uncharacterized protein ARMOST_03241 [Armillaria ostoyae]